MVAPEAPRARTRRQRLQDAVTARALTMPPGRHDWSVTGAGVPMRDGVELLADVHQPAATTSRGIVLIRTPYGRGGLVALLTAGYLASHGFTVVQQSCRGTFGSGGVWEPFAHEVADGADTVSWLREQPWFDGRFALYGTSYLGFAAWGIMTDPPPELACAVISAAAHDNYPITFPGGAFALEAMLSLADGMDHIEDPFLRGITRFSTAARRLHRGFSELPLVRAQETVLAGSSMPYAAWLRASSPDDPAWRDQRLQAALDRVTVPVLLHEGWQDRFVEQMLEQYATLRDRGVDVAVSIGPWNHVQMGLAAARVTMPETLDWLAEHLTGSGARRRRAPVSIHVGGATDEWRHLPSWPPAAESMIIYLGSGGRLCDDAPDELHEPSVFVYDPADPTPSVGGRVVNPAVAGSKDNRRLEERSDVLVFTGQALAEPLEVIGVPVVELAHASDNPHCDVFVRLCEVLPNGRSMNIADGFRRLDAADPSSTVGLALDAIAHRFGVGSRLRLQVSGGAHPRYARNLGTGEDPAEGTRLESSRRTIHHGRGGASRLVLPITGPPRAGARSSAASASAGSSGVG